MKRRSRYDNRKNPYYYIVWYTAMQGSIDYHIYWCNMYQDWERLTQIIKHVPLSETN